MSDLIIPGIKGIFLVCATLLPIINPLSTAPVFVSIVGHDEHFTRTMARRVAINCWIVMALAMVVGTYVLSFFGLSLAIVRVAGGLLVCATGWRMLTEQTDTSMQNAVEQSAPKFAEQNAQGQSFFPLTFPLTTGPGTIAASIAIGTELPKDPVLWTLGVVVILTGAGVTAGVIYFCNLHASTLSRKLGTVGQMVLIRLVAFILLCIGLNILWAGIMGLPRPDWI